jgi:hypothetical protein
MVVAALSLQCQTATNKFKDMNTLSATVTVKIKSLKCANPFVNARIVKVKGLETEVCNGIIYQAWQDQYGRPCAAVNTFKTKRDVSAVAYRTEEGRQQAIAEHKKQVIANQQAKAKEAEEAKDVKATAAASVKVGDILATSWGYEQTNVEFYQVIDAKGQRIILREIRKDYRDGGNMSGYSTPLPGKFATDKTVKLGLTKWGG